MNNKTTLLTVLFILLAHLGFAQAPKWLDKSKQAVFSVITYDKDGKIVSNSNGFFISEDGIGLSDYTSFKGAERAVIIGSDDKQMPVDVILGANSLYDVVKFRVDTGNKKVNFLPLTTTAPEIDATVYLMPYSTQKDRAFTQGKIIARNDIGENQYYYTLDFKLEEKKKSCPVLTADGKVFGIVQPATGKAAEESCYAVDASYGKSLQVSGLSMSDIALNSIGIRKGLPEMEDEATIYIMMMAPQLSDVEYKGVLDDFIKQFPKSAEGYIRRASYFVDLSIEDIKQMDNAIKDLNTAVSVADKKDEAHFGIANLIYNYMLSNIENKYDGWSFDKALEEIKKASAINPLPVYIQTEGNIYFAMKDYNAAYNSYERIFGSDLSSPMVYYSAAQAKEFMGADIMEIVALMDSCIAKCPQPILGDNAAFLLERAGYYMAAEMYRPAMQDYDSYYTAVNGRVNDLFYYYRAQSSFLAKQYQRALDDINKAIEINPEQAAYLFELGMYNIRVGRNEEAIEVLDKAITLEPEFGEAYRLRGVANIQLSKNNEACSDFNKALELGDELVESLIESHCK